MCAGDPIKQTCQDCPLYRESLGGMFAEAMRQGIVELSGVGEAWDDPEKQIGAEAILYVDDREVAARAATGEEALAKAMARSNP